MYNRRVVEQAQTDSLSTTLFDDDTAAPITLAGTNEITIYGPGGAELVASTAVSISAAKATYSRTWEAATFSRRRGFRAVWSLSDGSNTYIRTTYFEVVRRAFRSTLEDADFSARYPYLSSRLPSGVSDFSGYRRRAWKEIELMLAGRLPDVRRLFANRIGSSAQSDKFTGLVDSNYPGSLFNPEDFELAHENLTLSLFYEAISFDSPGSDESEKADVLRRRGIGLFDTAASNLAFDIDDDALLDVRERGAALTGISLIR